MFNSCTSRSYHCQRYIVSLQYYMLPFDVPLMYPIVAKVILFGCNIASCLLRYRSCIQSLQESYCFATILHVAFCCTTLVSNHCKSSIVLLQYCMLPFAVPLLYPIIARVLLFCCKEGRKELGFTSLSTA